MELDQLQLLSLDIDIRLRKLWEFLEEEGLNPSALALFSAYMRAAYGIGYVDALKEPRGKLCSDNGFAVPEEPNE